MFFEMMLHSAAHTLIEKTIHFVRNNSHRTTFLDYDVGRLLGWYRDEVALLGELPYTELAYFIGSSWPNAPAGETGIKVVRKTEPFQLASHPPANLARLQTYAYDAFTRENRVDRFDSRVVRLEAYNTKNRRLAVRPCDYSDGLRSNYALDWSSELEIAGQPFSLRSILAQQYGCRLPRLLEPRLSNAIGLAVVVWYRTDEGDILPYLPMRAEANLLDIALEKMGGNVKRSAVFRGGYHCTASGEAEWKPNATTFDEMFTTDICKELFEEVGLSRHDLEWIVPVALCREFLRGGKPQLFYCAFTNVEARELGSRRREAIKRQVLRGRQEVLDDALAVQSPEQLYQELATHGTIEAFANMIYAQRCAEVANAAGAFSLPVGA